MKHTAKISLLIALALIISVSGVYATWSYVEHTFNTAASPVSDQSTSLVITDAIVNSSDLVRGTIAVTGTPALSIDQASGSYKGVMNWTNPAYTVKYTPNDTHGNTNGVLPATAINVKCEITVMNGSETFDNKFTLADGTTKVDVFNACSFVVNLTNVTTAGSTVNLSEQLKLSDSFNLPTKADHTAFTTLLNQLKVVVTFSDAGVYSGT